MASWRDNIRQVEPYVPGEQPKNTNVIKLNTNENPYGPSPRVKAVQDNEDLLRLYPRIPSLFRISSRPLILCSSVNFGS